MSVPDRPLSPHLQIYKPQLTSVLSILHRATGIFLCCAIILLLYWIYAAVSGAEAYQTAISLFSSFVGRLILLACSFSLIYHLCNGIRHLFWDVGMGLTIQSVYRSGWSVIVISCILTLAIWLMAYAMRGGQ